MDILLITSEFAPFNHATAVAQSVASLAKALRGLHHKVTVVSPLYATIDPAARSLARRLSKVDVSMSGRSFQCELYDGRTTGGVDLIFVGERELFGSRADALTAEAAADVIPSAVFCRAAAQIASARDPQPDVVHALGAVASLALPYAKELVPTARLVLSVHDTNAVGAVGALDTVALAIDASVTSEFGLTTASSLLAIGAAVADRVLLRSATVAAAWLADTTALDGKLTTPPNRVLAIQEGVDAAIWNPLTDAALSARFDPMDLTGKRHCKAQLQRQLQLPERADVPLIVALVDAAAWSGTSALSSVVADLVNNDLQIAVVTRAAASEVSALAKLQERFPDRIALRADADDAVTHQGMGAADLLLLPSITESPDQLHRCAQRYGVLPIVARVGGVNDTVVDCDPELATGNGFVFDDEASLLATVQRAVAGYARGKAFEQLRVRVMRLDSSWERTARLYEQAVQSRKLTN